MNTKYPKLDAVSKGIANLTLQAINAAAQETDEPSMPYKAQYILETVIKILKERV